MTIQYAPPLHSGPQRRSVSHLVASMTYEELHFGAPLKYGKGGAMDRTYRTTEILQEYRDKIVTK